MARDDTRLTEWVLGILEKQAGEQVERELRDSVEAREALSELEELLGDVALAAEPLTPSLGVRERLLESLGAGHAVRRFQRTARDAFRAEHGAGAGALGYAGFCAWKAVGGSRSARCAPVAFRWWSAGGPRRLRTGPCGARTNLSAPSPPGARMGFSAAGRGAGRQRTVVPARRSDSQSPR